MNRSLRRAADFGALGPAAVGVLLLALSCIGWSEGPRVFLACWLAAWWWVLGLVLGSFVNAWMHALTGGAWGEAMRPVARALGMRWPAWLVLVVPVLAGLRLLYPWAAEPGGIWLHGVARPAFLQAWFSLPFFGLRIALVALAWGRATRPVSMERKGRAAASLVVHALATSLAALDLVMSLMPGWSSTAFGLVALCTQALSGAAFAVLCSALTERPHPARRPWRDLGNLLLMWSMSWAYLAFMQFLIIWAEDLPREIAWFLPRLVGGWRVVALALVLVQFALPCLALLFRAIKDRPRRLAVVAVLLLAGSLLDAAWLVLPSVDPHGVQAAWMVPLMAAGMALVVVGDPRRLLEVRGANGARRDMRIAAAATDGEARHAQP